MSYKITVMPGDGIGKEVTKEAVNILQVIGKKYSISFAFNEQLIGGAAIDATGVPLPDETLQACEESDGVLLGAVGGPKWDQLDYAIRPEKGLLKMRKELDLFANLRPAKLYSALTDASPLKKEIIQDLDIMIVRELTGDIYFGEPRGIEKAGEEEKGFNTMVYYRHEIERIVKFSFELAEKRDKRLTSVDKANVLDTSVLWRKVATEIGEDYPDIQLKHLYVDNCAMQLIRDPKQFDVIVTGNIFGDILSDEASMLTGSIGMLPSASIGGKVGVYEPVHGSAPDIEGKNMANPIAMITSAAMMLKYTFDLNEPAKEIDDAVEAVLEKGYRTGDIYKEGDKLVGTREMASLIAEEIEK
jgi:3-isopropylmalate dehydrogenase